MEIPDIYVASRSAFEDALQFMIPYNAWVKAQAPRFKVLDFPLVVEGLADLLFYVLPEEREAVLQRMRELMVLQPLADG